MQPILNSRGRPAGQTPALPSLRARLKAAQAALTQNAKAIETLILVESALRWKLGIGHEAVPQIVDDFIAHKKVELAKDAVPVEPAENPAATELPPDA
jgi:hypothetical protein